MIQRVQSIYLLLITVLMSFLLIRPYAHMVIAHDQILLFRTHAIIAQSANDVISTYKTTIPVIVLVLVIGILSFCTIFFFNHRVVQIRLSILNILLLLVLIGCMTLYYFVLKDTLDATKPSFRLAMIYPLMSLIFCIMAIRAIRKDELLVKALNRIR